MNRFKWPVPKREQLVEDLRIEDELTLEGRIDRLHFVLEEFGPPADMLLIGGIPSMFAIRELERSFINGNYLATILVAQVFIEHTFGGAYILAGEDKIGEGGFATLIDTSLRKGIITEELAEQFHELRKMRNPYTHPTSGDKAKGYIGRMKQMEVYNPEILLERDARRAIEIVVNYQRSKNPLNESDSHNDF